MRNRFFLFCFSLFFGVANAQFAHIDATVDFWDRVRFGGGLGLSTESGFFSASVSPSAIYEFNPMFGLGVGLSGTYTNRKNFYKATVFGSSLIGLFSPIQELQLSAEFEAFLVTRNFDNPLFKNDQYWYPALFLGVGYRTQNVTVGIRCNVLYNGDKSIYANAWMPFIRVYF
ncbi:alpha-ketoglutarate decarboxylase [Bizionia gelidisalsuginis]|uniref:alpha-ketoglutarate decarboxylase n=1 Tax=Bizionia gelidisalsuginis TaxID=291188 RepID=UPI001FE4FF24|nr:alpha-ketoglutarate decarboxylase [Bizionia gelidisalsuginis]